MSYAKVNSPIGRDNPNNAIDGNNVDDTENLVPVRTRSRPWKFYWNRLLSIGNTNTKPPSNPFGWPNSTEEDIESRPKRIISIGTEQDFSFNNNFVKTSKYEPWNFLPKFLFEEFDPRYKVANCYFLMVSGLQCIPVISNTNGMPTTLIPLLFIIVIDAVFQLLEDASRHAADRKANASIAYKFDKPSGQFISCKWYEVSVGDFIRIDTRSMIPADVVILSVSEQTEPAQGICYVETKSLDGETNLKVRIALPGTMSKLRDMNQLRSITGKVELEHPNKLINEFDGIIELNGITREPITANNVLLRGCVLRNTEWMIGFVVNTGHDTKIMMSSAITRSKRSTLEAKTSNEIKRIIILLGLVCFGGALGETLWNKDNDISNIWYLDWKYIPPVSFFFIDFFYFFLLHATFIPVSLYVSMSVIRFFQSYFMVNDLDMYYAATDTPALARTLTLNEELGQVSHIFTDKTGTLTCNIMDFRKASINGVSYGVGITEIGKAAWKLLGRPISTEMLDGEAKAKANSKPHVSFYCPIYERDITNGGEQKKKIKEFFRLLSMCHDVIPERVDGKLKLSASNPDDEALVCAAEYFGFEFRDRQDKICIIQNKDTNQAERIEVLNTIKFTSKRKRMSIIIKDIDNEIKILCKGADSSMIPRLQPNQDLLLQSTNKHMRDYAVEGLRCLVVGSAIIPKKEYEKWSVAYKAATTDLNQIDLNKKGLSNKIEDLEDKIEQNLTLIGCTAIEDKLQDGVPECIAELAKAGLSIWILTGDKEETAINIAVACNLVLPKSHMDHIIINSSKAPTEIDIRNLISAEIQRYENELDGENGNIHSINPRALIIDGAQSLTMIMNDTAPDGLKDLLLDLAERCKAVVACRVSPDQKRQMVNLIKEGTEGVITLAIGDGANDVAMIQEAHVGVGIKGEEGLQAVNSSDYAIAQFKFLSDLLLKHGRSNYIRMSSIVCYIFYKNILMSITQFWFNFSCAYSGQKYYTEGSIQMYNFLYTNFPLLLMGVYDFDLSPKILHLFPQVYIAGVNNEYFRPFLFWTWIFAAFSESLLISILPLFLLGPDIENYLDAGMTSFTVVVLIANFKLFFIQSKWYYTSYAVMGLSIVAYFVSIIFINSFWELDYNLYQVWNRLLANGSFWLTVILLTTLVLAKDIYVSGLERSFNFKPRHILEEMDITGRIDQLDQSPIETGTNEIASSSSSSSMPINIEMRSNSSNSNSNNVISKQRDFYNVAPQ